MVKKILKKLYFDILPNLLLWPTVAYRKCLRRVTFIGVTGSCGKTTTKDLAANILSTRFRGVKSFDSYNIFLAVILTILSSRFWHRFCIMEIATWEPGKLEQNVSLLKPHVAIVTNVRNDHYKAFRGRENVRKEKVKIVHALPASGIAILNADDPLVLSMKDETRARIITYGFLEPADVRATDVRSDWPSRLDFTVSYRNEAMPVKTRLLGTHLAGSALAALSMALAFDVPLSEAVGALEHLEPITRRMNPEFHPDNITFIRDDFKAPWDSMSDIIDFMKAARATRKIAVIGSISDFPGHSGSKYKKFATAASEVMDKVIFVGRFAPDYLKKLTKLPETKIRAFKLLPEANEYLSGYLQPGDLVMVKASAADHLWRLVLNRKREIGCWATRCAFKKKPCDKCRYLYQHWEPDDIPGIRNPLSVVWQ
ncbi:Mur ligase family protein [Thermodesulfobacteriota bacterium]